MATTQGGGSGPGEELLEEEEEEEVGFCATRGSAAEGSDGAAAGAVMTFSAQKCGICFQPPSIILIYRDNSQDKTRQRIMPVRNFSRFSDCSRAAEQLKNNPRHKAYLEGVSLRQLQKLYSLLRGHLEGQSLAESLEKFQQEQTIDPEEDMNKLDDKELAKRKRIMDELFEKNRKKKDDPDFVYNIEVEFPLDEQLESCTWDLESDEEI
ncbi:centrosomal protein of 19 kDa [Oenanthe melanoleuca]|uniref:centrosomal protein of 19 kDa n=1 Tax=Oenanthe melanoleuca TaxID=2939378 RepID=UPI0024C109B7|nr:centrosomal protein of 19 kDa [Oenanthe melanoleuca]